MKKCWIEPVFMASQTFRVYCNVKNIDKTTNILDRNTIQIKTKTLSTENAYMNNIIVLCTVEKQDHLQLTTAVDCTVTYFCDVYVILKFVQLNVTRSKS